MGVCNQHTRTARRLATAPAQLGGVRAHNGSQTRGDWVAGSPAEPNASRFDPHVGGNVAAAMPERADGGLIIGVQRFDQIFNRKPRPAHAAQQGFPAVQEFERAGLAVRTADDFGQRAGTVIGFGQKVTGGRRLGRRLQAGRLFVLTDIESAAAVTRATSR